MQREEIERLRYRRQYILSPHEIEPPFMCVKRAIESTHHLYIHVDLAVTNYSKDETSLVLLGDIFDYDVIRKNNFDILKDIINNDFNVLLKKLSSYTGCFVLIYVRHGKIFMVHDSTATKKIYHCLTNNGVWCASQPSMLAKTLGLKRSNNKSKLRYYYISSEFKALNHASIGNTTCFDEITQVLPNHYLDLNQNRSIRFWPFEDTSNQMTLQETAFLCAKMIKGFMESIASRYKVMLPVTAGKDSRTLLAATSTFRENVFYYINKPKNFKNSHKDIVVPSRLFKRLGLEYHIVDPYIPIHEDFKRVYFGNNEFASVEHLPFINNYYVNYSNLVNLPGNIASGAIWYYPIYKTANNISLAKTNGVQRFKHALETYDDWLKDSTEACRAYNFNIWYLFYWEERLGNWGTQYQIDKDIAQMDINPFNSRLLVQYILSVEPPYKIEAAKYVFTKEIINNLWPEVLSEPINPTLKNSVYKFFDHLGLLHHIFRYTYK